MKSIPLSYPSIGPTEIQLVTEVLRGGRLSIGPMIEEFESLVAQRCERTHGVGVSSGTAGLHLALLALGVGPGDEVICPAFSFIASANCIEYVGAKPVFVDCDPRTLNMRATDVEPWINESTKAIITVEVFGNPSGMDELAALCNRYEIPMIEDSCEGLGGRTGSRPIGSYGRMAIFGFYPNKQITTGEGGMIVTDDDRLASLCRSLRNQGRSDAPAADAADEEDGLEATTLGTWLQHEHLGYNYRLSEIHSALGVAQMRRLDELIEARQQVALSYTRRLSGNADLILPTVEPSVAMSWFVYVVRLSDQFSVDDRDEIIDGLRRHEVGASNYFPPIPLQPYYQHKYGFEPGQFPVTEFVSDRTLALPFFADLTEHEVDLICQTLELMITRITFARK